MRRRPLPPSRRRLLGRLAEVTRGPYPVLPRPVDALAEWWARLRPRVRLLVVVSAALLLVAGLQARVAAVERRWGGAPVAVLVADRDLPVGAPLEDLSRTPFPPDVVPPGALTDPPADAVLALALPEGSVLTAGHVDAVGPGAGLDEELRAVPIPVEDGLPPAGGWVDVWVLGLGDEPATLVARSRPVLEVRDGEFETAVLVGLHVDEVGPATEGLAVGQVLLAHAPPP